MRERSSDDGFKNYSTANYDGGQRTTAFDWHAVRNPANNDEVKGTAVFQYSSDASVSYYSSNAGPAS
jgi:hypothetical protein